MGVGAKAQENFAIYTLNLCFKTLFPVLKLSQNCYIHYNINIFFLKTGNLIIHWLLFSEATCRIERPSSPFHKI